MLRDYVREAIVEASSKEFDTKRFESLPPDDRVEYLDFHAKVVNSGAGRTVFDIGYDLVVKLANNRNGRLQNKKEALISSQAPKNVPIVRVRRQDTMGWQWIVADKVQIPVGKGALRLLKATVGLASYDDLSAIVSAGMDPKLADPRDASDHDRLFSTNAWYQSLFNVVEAFDIDPQELHGDNWGVNAGGQLVLLDLGG